MKEKVKANHSEEIKQIDIIYPRISHRIKAAFTDSCVIICFMIIFTFTFSQFENVSDSVRIAGFIFIFGLYDPLFTSLFGGTIGHMVMNIRVKRSGNQNKNILFPLAIIRYILKILLGWISLITVENSKKKLAIHDMVVGSIVIHNK